MAFSNRFSQQPASNVNDIAAKVKNAKSAPELAQSVVEALEIIQDQSNSDSVRTADLQNIYTNPQSNPNAILIHWSHLFGDQTLTKLIPYGSPTVQAIAAVGNKIIPLAATVRIANNTAGALTLTSTPTIPNGSPWQEITVVNSGAQNVVIQDRGTLANSNLALVANTRTLAPRQSITLQYDLDLLLWREKYFSAVL